jgi:hypothetical protein
MPFGLSLSSTNVHNFLLENVQHKLNYGPHQNYPWLGGKWLLIAFFSPPYGTLWVLGEGPKKESLELIAF